MRRIQKVRPLNRTHLHVEPLEARALPSLAAPVLYTAGAGPVGVAVADFNGDGKPDFVVTNSHDNTVSVFLNDGEGGFRPAVGYAAGPGPNSVAVGDFNGDGKPDIAVADANGTGVSVLFNQGDGTRTIGSLDSIKRKNMVVDKWYNYYQKSDTNTLFGIIPLRGKSLPEADINTQISAATLQEAKLPKFVNPDPPAAQKPPNGHIWIMGVSDIFDKWVAALSSLLTAAR
jgi:hypothetical protein